MHIVVCVKQIPDPEAAFSMFKVDEQAKEVIAPAGLHLVMSPFDEQALEAALRVRDQTGAAKIIAISVGPDSARNTLKHALAMGADEAVLVNDAALENSTSEITALVLARAIARLGAVDLVLTGRQAADSDAGIVGCGVAELLDMPVAPFACKIDIDDRIARVERVLSDGFETVDLDLPAVITVSNEIGAVRAASLRETMRAARKPLTTWSLSDIGLSGDELARVARRRVRERVYVPTRVNRCELISGADESARAAALAGRLRAARLI